MGDQGKKPDPQQPITYVREEEPDKYGEDYSKITNILIDLKNIKPAQCSDEKDKGGGASKDGRK
jgi:hypothetical protein